MVGQEQNYVQIGHPKICLLCNTFLDYINTIFSPIFLRTDGPPQLCTLSPQLHTLFARLPGRATGVQLFRRKTGGKKNILVQLI